MNDIYVWLLGFYVVGTVFGYLWGFKKGAMVAAEGAIDSLMEQGIIKWSRDSNGEIQIHKYDE